MRDALVMFPELDPGQENFNSQVGWYNMWGRVTGTLLFATARLDPHPSEIDKASTVILPSGVTPFLLFRVKALVD